MTRHAVDLAQPSKWDGLDIKPLLDLERIDTDLFRNRVNEINMNQALFGGQVLSQALQAAVSSVEPERPVHSMHGYFLRPGAGDRLVIYQVERTRDGGSFSTRRVTALQNGSPIFHMEASFHRREDHGLDHVVGPSAEPPPPDGLLDLAGLAEQFGDAMDPVVSKAFSRERAVEIRPTDPEQQLLAKDSDGRLTFWLRIKSAKELEAERQVCAIAYASDMWLAMAARRPHAGPGDVGKFMMASLDHSIWFHAPIRADEWHLYEVMSPWTGGGRGMSRGMIFDLNGKPLASLAQEILLRVRRTDA